MGTISTVLVILGSVSLFIIVVSWGLFSVKKKKTKKEEPNKKEESKKVENPESKTEKIDDQFKVTKLGRFSRISKKALTSDSRTATVERVYEKTPDKEPEDQIINPMPLSQESEELIDSLNQIDKTESGVVSIGELQKEAEALDRSEATIVEEPVPAEDTNNFNSRYSGIGIGMNRSKAIQNPSEQSNLQNSVHSEMESIKNRIFGNQNPAAINSFDMPPRFRTNSGLANSAPKTEDINYSDMIESEVILNPKFKNRKNKK